MRGRNSTGVDVPATLFTIANNQDGREREVTLKEGKSWEGKG